MYVEGESTFGRCLCWGSVKPAGIASAADAYALSSRIVTGKYAHPHSNVTKTILFATFSLPWLHANNLNTGELARCGDDALGH